MKKYIIHTICISLIFLLTSCSFSENALTWTIGVLLSFMGIATTTILGVQIYNSLTLDKRIKDAAHRIVEQNAEELKKSEIKASLSCFYRIEVVALKLNIAIMDFDSSLKNLKSMVEYAIFLQEPETLNDSVTMLINSYAVINKNNREFACENVGKYLHIAKSLLCYIQAESEVASSLHAFIYELTQLEKSKKTSSKESFNPASQNNSESIK